MLAGRVVVDVDREDLIQPLDPRAADIGALDHKDRIVLSVDLTDVFDQLGSRKIAIGRRYVSMHDDLSVLSERAQQPVQAQRRADAIAIRLDMRRNTEVIPVFD